MHYQHIHTGVTEVPQSRSLDLLTSEGDGVYAMNMKRAFHASMIALSIGLSGAWPTGIAAAKTTPSAPPSPTGGSAQTQQPALAGTS
jgi:hypothetical protein